MRGSRRIQLPPVDAPVEARGAVRERARSRVRLIGGILSLLLVAVGARGVQLCLDPHPRTVRAGSMQRYDQVRLKARRGEIVDRNGRRLATSVDAPSVIVDPMLVDPEEAEALAARVAEVLQLDAADVAVKLQRDSRYVKLASRVHPAVAAQIEQLGHSSLWIQREANRYYPEETVASQVLGHVNAAGEGREGLEGSLDRYLQGGSVLVQRSRDRRGLDRDRPAGLEHRANAGMDVHLTLDRNIQRMAERALAGVVERHAPASANVVVVDVATGDVLAMANAPEFNPNALDPDPAPRRNHVIQDAIEAGSVFKPFSVAAALEEGIVGEDSLVDCEGGAWYIGRTRIRDDHPHGVVTVGEVIKYSSNIGSAKLALQLGAERFLGYVHAFGFGERTGIPLPGERRGRVRSAERIKPIELATTSYGQGVTSTSLQLAMATAAIANGGVRMKPRLVTRVEDQHGVPEWVQRPTPVTRVISEETAAAVGRMMQTVTEPGGTATRARVPGYRVAGKTGTAEKVENGRYGAGRIGSFVGYVPADDPVLAIVVVVDEPTTGSRYGGINATPAFAEIAGQALRYLGVPPDPTLLPLPEEDPSDAVAALDEEPSLLVWETSTWTLPDLTGRSLREVLSTLEGSGLSIDLNGSGVAVAQSPTAGERLPMGATVSVTLR